MMRLVDHVRRSILLEQALSVWSQGMLGRSRVSVVGLAVLRRLQRVAQLAHDLLFAEPGRGRPAT